MHRSPRRCPACGRCADSHPLNPLKSSLSSSRRTVSADPSLHEECFRGAKFLLRLLEGLGAEVKLCQPVEDKNPLVLARLGRDPAKPTVTFYGACEELLVTWGRLRGRVNSCKCGIAVCSCTARVCPFL